MSLLGFLLAMVNIEGQATSIALPTTYAQLKSKHSQTFAIILVTNLTQKYCCSLLNAEYLPQKTEQVVPIKITLHFSFSTFYKNPINGGFLRFAY
jgi:hypothetical protein